MSLDYFLTLRDFETAARTHMEPTAWEYYAGGAEDEYSITDNETVFQRIKLRPRMMVDVTQRDLSTEVCGVPLAFPLILAPTTYQRLAHPDAELAVSRAAHAMGIINCLGTGNHYSIDEVAQATTGPLWFQPYPYVDRTIIERLVRRGEEAGCRALVMTVDASYPARRMRHLRRPLLVPPDIELRNIKGIGLENYTPTADPKKAAVFATGGRVIGLTWDDIAWLRRTTQLPLLIKGILTAEDAILCVEHGVDGIIVSNHGARQLDTVVTGVEVLPEIVAAVGDKAEIILDGGIRRGTDVLKAIALGAKAVMMGRPFLWGLAVAGEAGVRRVLEILYAEMETAMVQLGRPTIASIDQTMVRLPAHWS